MTLVSTTALPDTVDNGWTCPFCALLCEGLEVDRAGASPGLPPGGCARAQGALAALQPLPAAAGPSVDGVATPLDSAVQAAAERLAQWQLPLFGGLGTDVAGARALFRLAAASGALCDHADGAALLPGMRSLQDRGQFTTTLAELRSRADLVLFVGTDAVAHYPEFFHRAGFSEPGSPCRNAVFLGVAPPAEAAGSQADAPSVLHLPGSGDLFADVQQLAALVDQRRVPGADAALSALAQQLRSATYAVVVWEGGQLPAHGALLVELLNRIVGALNRKTRAALFSLGGSYGAYGVNQAFTWLSGLPLRTWLSPAGLQHEPHLYDTAALLARGAVDGLLWITSFAADRLPPPSRVPKIVLGPPTLQALMNEPGAPALALTDCVFIPVATPGLNAAGHLFRTDGTVVLPVHPLRDDGLPGVAQVLDMIRSHLPPAARLRSGL